MYPRQLKSSFRTLYFNIFQPFLVDGGYGNWSLNGACNVTCGPGLERWSRQCNNPEPKYGGRNCSHLGDPVEYRPCSAKPCSGKVIFGTRNSWYKTKAHEDRLLRGEVY